MSQESYSPQICRQSPGVLKGKHQKSQTRTIPPGSNLRQKMITPNIESGKGNIINLNSHIVYDHLYITIYLI